MKISLIRILGVCAAATIALVPIANAQTCANPRTVVNTAQVLETRVDTDTVYTPIQNEVITRLPIGDKVVAPVDTLKTQILNTINSGIVSGKITETEADRLYAAFDDIARQEATFKLAGLTDAAINNLMRKYHVINQSVAELSNNTDTNDYMPSIEVRRDRISRHIRFNVAAGNLTPAEGEQLLVALNTISDNYATYRATGGMLTADELEAVHKDMFRLERKITDRAGALIARVVPVSNPPRNEYLRQIQQGLASKTLSSEEGARLLSQYNRLVLLEQSIASNDGVRSADIQQLSDEIKNLNFILTRELRDRAIAGQANKL